MREPSAIPPAIPAAAAVPTSAGIFAFCATVPTESPAFPTAEPMEPPTPVRVPVTPLVDCREADEPDLAPRDLFALDGLERDELRAFDGLERAELRAPDERLELDEARVLRVAARLGELPPRDGGLPLLAEPAGRAFDEPLELEDARGLRVAARLAELPLRDGGVPLLRAAPAELPLRRVLVWAM